MMVEFRSLSDLAFDQAVETFEKAPFHPEERLEPPALATKFFDSLPTNTFPAIAAEYIENDDYWKRACQDTGKSMRLEEHCFSYKQLFFEQYIQQVVKECGHDSEQLLVAVKPLSDFIQKLKLEQLPRGLPIDLLCKNLSNLSKLELNFSQQSNIQGLRKAISSAPSLTSLVLKDNLITDDDLEGIFSSLSQCNLTHLDLSHNKISCGVEILVDKFVATSSMLSHLDLSGNKVCQKGAARLGAALAYNESLTSLNLALNELGDDGGVQLLKGVAQNQYLRNINLSSNLLSDGSARIILGLQETCIESIVLTSNLFSDEDLKKLAQHRACLVGPTFVDSRGNGIGCLASEVPSSK